MAMRTATVQARHEYRMRMEGAKAHREVAVEAVRVVHEVLEAWVPQQAFGDLARQALFHGAEQFHSHAEAVFQRLRRDVLLVARGDTLGDIFDRGLHVQHLGQAGGGGVLLEAILEFEVNSPVEVRMVKRMVGDRPIGL